MSLVTRCPICGTAFRVQSAQLAAHGGSVRCGKCGGVFNGVAALVEEGDERLALAFDQFQLHATVGLLLTGDEAIEVDARIDNADVALNIQRRSAFRSVRRARRLPASRAG